MSNKPSLSYKDAGVDIDAGDALVQRIKSVAKATSRPEVVGGLGGFGALCRIPTGYTSPLLVSGTDGVGTKLKLALQLNRHDTIGIDVLIALASSGAHSNGYSLVRKVIEVSGVDVTSSDEQLDGQSIQDALMAPTRIYVKAIKSLQDTLGSSALHAMSHITGGGLTDNLPRVLPDNLAASIDTNSWQFSELFTWLQTQGNIEQSEMYRTFNCGIGFVIVVPKDKAEAAIQILNDAGEKAWQLGEMVKRSTDGQADAVVYR